MYSHKSAGPRRFLNFGGPSTSAGHRAAGTTDVVVVEYFVVILWAADTRSHRSAILTLGKVVSSSSAGSAQIRRAQSYFCLVVPRNARDSFLTYRATNISTRLAQMGYFLTHGTGRSIVTILFVRLTSPINLHS